jgi:hypothetical protein
MKPTNTNDPRYRAAYLAHMLAAPSSSPHVVACLVRDMQRAARSAVTYETNRCNYPMTEAQEKRSSRRIQKLEDGINARIAAGGDLRFDCDHVAIHDIETDHRG